MEIQPRKQDPAAERRLQPRLEIEMPAAYRRLTRGSVRPGTADERPLQAARVKNLGPGGVLLLVSEPLAFEAVLSLRLTLPGHDVPVHSLVTVRHLRPYQNGSAFTYAAGVEFLSISSRDTSAIARVFLRHRMN